MPVSDQVLLDLLRTQLRPAWKLELTPIEHASSLPVVGTCFGGTPYAESGESWPICPGCSQRLTFIGQFDTHAARLPLAPHLGLFTFFYCWNCRPAGCGGEIAGSWVVRVHATPAADRRTAMLPAEEPARVTRPCSVQLVPMTSHPDWDEVQWRLPELLAQATLLDPAEPYTAYGSAVEELVGDFSITTQMGGHARWIQDVRHHTCRVCGEPLQFVLQIDSLCEADCDWGLSGLLYLQNCPAHADEWALDILFT
jgi:hypothetical protein